VKRYRYLSGLLLSLLFIFPSSSSRTLTIKDRSPATEQSTIALLCLCLSARFYTDENTLQVRGWQLEHLALVKIIKDNAAPLWHHHPARNIISLEDWKK
jgi:hypothetical protein